MFNAEQFERAGAKEIADREFVAESVFRCHGVRFWKLSAITFALMWQACGSDARKMTEERDSLWTEFEASMEEFQNRTIYTSLDPETLAAIPDDDVEQAVVDYVNSKLGDDYGHEKAILDTLAQGARALYLTWIVEAEVYNGGFNQYYWNTDGRFAADAVEAFEYFGAAKHAELMREANAARAAEEAAMAKYKEQGTLEAFSDSYEESKLDPLDTKFYDLSSEDLRTLRIQKIRRSPEEFSGN